MAQQKQMVEIKGYVYDREDSTLIPYVPVIFKVDSALVMVKGDSLGFYSCKVDKDRRRHVKFYTQTTKELKTETAPHGFLATELKYEIGLTKDTIRDEYNFLLQRVWACEPSFTFLFKRNISDLLDSVRIINPDLTSCSYRRPQHNIQDMVDILDRAPGIVIELGGHASSDEQKVDSLSRKRAERVKQLLITEGIDTGRIVARGYGIKKLKLTNATIAKYKSKEEREALHSVNRRVVFKIIAWDYPGLPKKHVRPESPKYPFRKK